MKLTLPEFPPLLDFRFLKMINFPISRKEMVTRHANRDGESTGDTRSRYGGIFVRRTAAALLFLLLLSGSIFVPSSSATGFGVYGLLGSGRTEFHEDTDYVGWGFVYDTAVAKNKVFNYRLNFGHERLRVHSSFGKETFSGYVLDSDFGLGIVRNDSVRLWLGPEVRIAILDTEWGFGVGPVVGLNLNASEVATIIIKAGYRWMSYSDLLNSTMDESHGFFSVGLMFRLRGDRFRPQYQRLVSSRNRLLTWLIEK